ncbi:hypothetical protein GCD22_00668 [Acidithiobacillus thiooxidans ATCC 19377]|uniref:Uncharacterized protein n=1 Tax=Acidithiobacillus thiooxidans ATCC 19377 TaxID=637390 RepID=A0A5P9XP53_ACITH|nr:hypothetical protein GCD22_00668 [Acidithiobacillus thiooxidans ATCC 19377]
MAAATECEKFLHLGAGADKVVCCADENEQIRHLTIPRFIGIRSHGAIRSRSFRGKAA